ncbi:MAG: FISUMP domain-containing protein [Bacteroidia bacterium]|jgi:uncharacterized protein (TIGR02145 family)
MPKALSLLIFVLFTFHVTAQQFINLHASKEGKMVIVSYDILTNKAGQTFDVKLECSGDDGKTFKIFPQFVSGDLKEISAGNGKKIVWNIEKEQEKLVVTQLMFQLVATENKPAGTNPENAGNFTDSRDGHVYQWLKIGTQIWMVENLAFLPAVSPCREGSVSKPFYYVYGYAGINVADAKASGNYKTYGVLYNWIAAKKACPVGWHLPTDQEWKELEIELGMSAVLSNAIGSRGKEYGAKMKASQDWYKLGNGTNSSKFSALPGGGRYGDGSFGNTERNGYWWSSSEFDGAFSWGRGLGYDNSEIYKGVNYKENGFSVRCIKDSIEQITQTR